MTNKLVTAERLAKVSGFSVDWVRKHARKGTFPGAYKLGGVWRFDEAKFQRWIEQKERGPCPSTGEAKRGGFDSSGVGRRFDDQLKHLYGV